MTNFSPAEAGLLRALAQGATLKSHRHLDGHKEYLMHWLDGETVEGVAEATVIVLRERGLIDSNKKFPAATYLLTSRGRAAAATLSNDDVAPLGARDF